MEGKDKGIPGTEKSMCKEPVVGESLGVQGTERRLTQLEHGDGRER